MSPTKIKLVQMQRVPQPEADSLIFIFKDGEQKTVNRGTSYIGIRSLLDGSRPINVKWNTTTKPTRMSSSEEQWVVHAVYALGKNAAEIDIYKELI